MSTRTYNIVRVSQCDGRFVRFYIFIFLYFCGFALFIQIIESFVVRHDKKKQKNCGIAVPINNGRMRKTD